MKKGIKIALIAILTVIVLYAAYLFTDCIRLQHAESGTKPFVTVATEETEQGVLYQGLGYSVEYYMDRGTVTEIDGTTAIEQSCYGAECRLFDQILLWAWVE